MSALDKIVFDALFGTPTEEEQAETKQAIKELFLGLITGTLQTDYDTEDNVFVEDIEWNHALNELREKVEEL